MKIARQRRPLWIADPQLIFLLGLLTIVASPRAESPQFDQGPLLNLTEENDFVNGTDRWYTQGLRISYLQADNDVPRWTKGLLDFIPSVGFTTGAERIGYQFGQLMFTPANTHVATLLPDDRPYAGWLYTGLVLQRRGVGWGDFVHLENFQLDIGIVGPDSLAEAAQGWYHDVRPPGWQNQLGDEPGVALRYGRACLIPLYSDHHHLFDFIPAGGLSVGNIDTSFRVGTTLRFGWNLPQDFGAQPIQSLIMNEGGRSPSQTGKRWGAYIFSGVEGSAVLYTVFLDGNTFRDSHHVDKEPFVGEWRSGIVFIFDRVEVAYTHIIRTEEFTKQSEAQIYGSLTIKCKF
jgi:hypothetical protein